MVALTDKQKRPLQSKRTLCPSCGSSDGLALYEGSKDEGYCFSCAKVIGSAQGSALLSKLERRERLEKWYKYSTSESIAFRNGLSSYLIDKLGEGARAHLRRWEVGTDSIGSCVFWHKDEAGELASAKTIAYDAQTAKRLKGKSSPIRWTVNGEERIADSIYGLVRGKREDGSLVLETYSQKKGYELPLYGAHLLAEAALDVPVLLVESEKTAVIASYFLPEFVVVACGGAKTLTEKKASALIGRVVYVLTDADEAGREGAQKACEVLYNVGAKPRVEVDGVALIDFLLEDAPKGYDLADYYLAEAATLVASKAIVEPATVIEELSPTLQIGELKDEDVAELLPVTTAVEAKTVESSFPALTGGREAIMTALLRVYGQEEKLSLDELHTRIEVGRVAGGKALVGMANMEGLLELRYTGQGYECYKTRGKAWTK